MRQVLYSTEKNVSKIMMPVATGLEAVGYVSLLDLKRKSLDNCTIFPIFADMNVFIVWFSFY